MRPHRTLIAALGLSIILTTLAASGSPAVPPTRRSAIVQAVNRAKRSVVNIHSERTARGPAVEELFATAPSQQRSNGMGTGIIIDPRGYIATNHHVIEDVSVIRVRLSDGTTHNARVLARERESDLALLKIDAGWPLPTIPLGTSSDLMVGETVIAIGNAYGYEHTVTVGVISALKRDVTLNKDISYKSLIQTDASINPGNSGGPLLNIDGELVGVNVAIRAGAQGIGFAIPVDQMIQVVADLLANKRRGEASPGLVCRNLIDLDQSPARSLKVERVDPTGPAARAGIKEGDVLVRVGELSIACSLDLERALIDRKGGELLPIRVRRGDTERQLELTLHPTPRDAHAGEPSWRQLGLRLTPVGAERVSRVSSVLRGGMQVIEVRPGSPAARAGIERGDILVGLDQRQTTNVESISWILNRPQLNSLYPLEFHLIRGGQLHQGSLQAAD
jgi:serine protease Do